MENYVIGEIVWAKIRGYPWWPATINEISEENKENKYVVGFIGDNTHAVLPIIKLAKFIKEFKNFSKTKKRTLLESIKLAKEKYENKFISEAEEKNNTINKIESNKNINNNFNLNSFNSQEYKKEKENRLKKLSIKKKIQKNENSSEEEGIDLKKEECPIKSVKHLNIKKLGQMVLKNGKIGNITNTLGKNKISEKFKKLRKERLNEIKEGKIKN